MVAAGAWWMKAVAFHHIFPRMLPPHTRARCLSPASLPFCTTHIYTAHTVVSAANTQRVPSSGGHRCQSSATTRGSHSKVLFFSHSTNHTGIQPSHTHITHGTAHHHTHHHRCSSSATSPATWEGGPQWLRRGPWGRGWHPRA